MSQYCSNCRFWQKADDVVNWHGECHRHAPRSDTTLPGAFPKSREDDWCGEYEHGSPRKAA